MKMTQLSILIFILLMVIYGNAQNVPAFRGMVTDDAQILSSETEVLLDNKIGEHERHTGNQIAILTVPGLQGYSIEEFAVKVFETWKIGSKEKDNGILILVAPSDRQMRIEVGYGLESVLTDMMAGQVIRNVMTPRFKENNFNGGISSGTDAVIQILEKGKFTDTMQVNKSVQSISLVELIGALFTIAVITFIAIFIFILTVSWIFGRIWFTYLMVLPFWIFIYFMISGGKGIVEFILIYVVSIPLIKYFFRNTRFIRELRQNGQTTVLGYKIGFKSDSSSSSGSGSGSSRSSYSSSSSSSSSRSSGGGSSGGGGASGRW